MVYPLIVLQSLYSKNGILACRLDRRTIENTRLFGAKIKPAAAMEESCAGFFGRRIDRHVG
jgi:hypothetical protein